MCVSQSIERLKKLLVFRSLSQRNHVVTWNGEQPTAAPFKPIVVKVIGYGLRTRHHWKNLHPVVVFRICVKERFVAVIHRMFHCHFQVQQIAAIKIFSKSQKKSC
jgi:hypothetical protein